MIGVLAEGQEMPNPDPHTYEGEFGAICATKEAAYKAGWRKVV